MYEERRNDIYFCITPSKRRMRFSERMDDLTTLEIKLIHRMRREYWIINATMTRSALHLFNAIVKHNYLLEKVIGCERDCEIGTTITKCRVSVVATNPNGNKRNKVNLDQTNESYFHSE